MLCPDNLSNSQELLRASALVCERGLRPLFAPVSFALHGGELIEVRGANGIGKTTLLRALAGLSRPAHGQVTCAFPPDEIASMGYIGHAVPLHPQLTVEENLRFWLQLEARDPDTTAVGTALDRTGLAAISAYPTARLSQGQRRRVALARLCAAPRRLWILDEPDAGLDESGLQLMRALVNEHLERDGAAIVATHLPASIASRARSLVIGKAS